MAVGFFLLFMSLSGAILVFSDEWEEAADAPWVKVHNPSGAFSYDASVPVLQAQYPEWELRAYGQPEANEALIYELRKGELRKRVYVHPVDGSILHVTEQAQWYKQLLLFHYTLFSGTTGKVAVFFIGVFFLASLLTGFYVYRRSIVKVLLFRVRLGRKNKRNYNSSLHRIVGVWSLLFNLLLVSAGLALAGKVSLAALEGKKAPKGDETAATVTSVDAHRAALLKAYKDFEVHMVRIRPTGHTISFSGRYKDDPFYYGTLYSSFAVNVTSGEVEKKVVLRNEPLSKRLLSFSGPLHFGNWGGLPVKILYCFFGLTPALLSLTGFFIWMRAPKKKTGAPVTARKASAVN